MIQRFDDFFLNVCVCEMSGFISTVEAILAFLKYQQLFLVTLQTEINILWMCWSCWFHVYILQFYFQFLFIQGDVLLRMLAPFQLSFPALWCIRYVYVYPFTLGIMFVLWHSCCYFVWFYSQSCYCKYKFGLDETCLLKTEGSG